MENIKNKQKEIDAVIDAIDKAERKLDEGVTKGYKKIESGVVEGYKNILNARKKKFSAEILKLSEKIMNK